MTSVRTAGMRQSTAPLIAGFRIVDLYGRYSYSYMSESAAEGGGGEQGLMLLYGDNGSGKTTLLRLLWHLLSPARNRGHRSFIARTPFREFEVYLSTNHRIRVTRTEALIGTYAITVYRGKRKLFTKEYPTDDEFSVKPPELTASKISRYLERSDRAQEYLADPEAIYTDLMGDSYVTFLEQELELHPYMLADDRNVHSDDIPEDDVSARVRARESLKPSSTSRTDVQAAMSRATESLRQMTFGATASGTENVNSVYLEVLTRLTKVRKNHPRDVEPSELQDRLLKLDHITADYARFQLLPRLDAERFVTLLNHIGGDRLAVAQDVLGPYLESVETRIEALRGVHTLLETLTTRANGFLRDKQLRFTVRRGLTIAVPEEDGTLSPSSLSSGERQLLLLFCNTIVARDRAGVFLIDEPEISLNVKWQRKLLGALLDLTAGTGVQFIVATHSIEMISPHRDSLVVLRGGENGEHDS